jgi:hypothetical protein
MEYLFLDICLPIKKKHNYKSVKFDETIRIILIPSIYDDILKKLKKNLWYCEDDYKFFIDERKNILKRSKTMDNLIL